jgi:hypothetical protein
VLGGFVAVDDALRGPGHRVVEPFLGGHLTYAFRPRWTAFGDLVASAFPTDTFREDVTTFTARAGLELSFPSGAESTWFVNGAAGYTEIHSDEPKVWSGVASAGVGQRIPVGPETSLRWELRVDGWLAEDGLEGNSVVQPRFVMGWIWGGDRERRPADVDGDGVPDRLDRCPASPRGAAVKSDGCVDSGPAIRQPPQPAQSAPEPDADGDGVPDSIDACDKTLHGIEVDHAGCPRDEDRDGVYDGLGMDKCPGTPPGTPVDTHGCPVDGDGDGVRDGLDTCPATPAGQAVDASGCPAG